MYQQRSGVCYSRLFSVLNMFTTIGLVRFEINFVTAVNELWEPNSQQVVSDLKFTAGRPM